MPPTIIAIVSTICPIIPIIFILSKFNCPRCSSYLDCPDCPAPDPKKYIKIPEGKKLQVLNSTPGAPHPLLNFDSVPVNESNITYTDPVWLPSGFSIEAKCNNTPLQVNAFMGWVIAVFNATTVIF